LIEATLARRILPGFCSQPAERSSSQPPTPTI